MGLQRWHGSIAVGGDVSILIDHGHYDLRIRVEELLETKTYKTGYKQPVSLGKNETRFIIYDGNGIYDN